jgi:hypothetical protein
MLAEVNCRSHFRYEAQSCRLDAYRQSRRRNLSAEISATYAAHRNIVRSEVHDHAPESGEMAITHSIMQNYPLSGLARDRSHVSRQLHELRSPGLARNRSHSSRQLHELRSPGLSRNRSHSSQPVWTGSFTKICASLSKVAA